MSLVDARQRRRGPIRKHAAAAAPLRHAVGPRAATAPRELLVGDVCALVSRVPQGADERPWCAATTRRGSG